MAKLVTHIFKGTRAEILLYRADTKETQEMDMLFDRRFKDVKAVEKAVAKEFKNNLNFKFVAVLNYYPVAEKRCMTADHFYAESEPVLE